MEIMDCLDVLTPIYGDWMDTMSLLRPVLHAKSGGAAAISGILTPPFISAGGCLLSALLYHIQRKNPI